MLGGDDEEPKWWHWVLIVASVLILCIGVWLENSVIAWIVWAAIIAALAVVFWFAT